MSNPHLTEEACYDAIRTVKDPELGLNIVDMGFIYDLKIEGKKVFVKMTLTSAGCPMAQSLVYGVRLALKKLPPVHDVDVELVWDPPWKPEMMTEEGRAMVGM